MITPIFHEGLFAPALLNSNYNTVNSIIINKRSEYNK